MHATFYVRCAPVTAPSSLCVSWLGHAGTIIRYICREVWPQGRQDYYYTLALFTLQFIVPLLVLIFTYTRIAIAVWGKRPPGEAENSRDQRMARSKRKVSSKLSTPSCPQTRRNNIT